MKMDERLVQIEEEKLNMKLSEREREREKKREKLGLVLGRRQI